MKICKATHQREREVENFDIVTIHELLFDVIDKATHNEMDTEK